MTSLNSSIFLFLLHYLLNNLSFKPHYQPIYFSVYYSVRDDSLFLIFIPYSIVIETFSLSVMFLSFHKHVYSLHRINTYSLPSYINGNFDKYHTVMLNLDICLFCQMESSNPSCFLPLTINSLVQNVNGVQGLIFLHRIQRLKHSSQ